MNTNSQSTVAFPRVWRLSLRYNPQSDLQEKVDGGGPAILVWSGHGGHEVEGVTEQC